MSVGVLRTIVWPGMPDRSALARAAEATGRDLEIVVVSSNEELERLMTERGPWDLVTPSDYMVEKLVAAGRLIELDPEGRLDRNRLAEWCRRPEYDPDERFSWPLAFGTTGILFDRELIPGSLYWREFFQPASGVKVGLLSEIREVIGAALLAIGRPPNSTDPMDLAAAQELLERQRPAVGSISSDDFTGPVIRGEVSMHQAWSGPAAAAARGHQRFGYAVPEDGALLWVTTAAIPADAVDPAGARRLLENLIKPANGRLAVENGGYSTPDEQIRAVLPDPVGADPILFPDPEVIRRCDRLVSIDETAEQALRDVWP